MRSGESEISKLSERELDRLIALSRRKPYGEAALLWTMVWGACFAGVWLFDDTFVFSGSLARVGLVLLLTGVTAALLCWAFAWSTQKSVDRARAKLKALSREVSPR